MTVLAFAARMSPRLALGTLIVLGLSWTQQASGQTSGQDARRSGFDFMSAATQALQRDDSQNPVMLWVRDGVRRWHEAPTGAPVANATPAAQSCASCHGGLESSMSGVAARYPLWDEKLRVPVNLQRRINLCRERHQGRAALPSEDDALLAIEAAIALQSRGQALSRADDPRLAPALERGAALFSQRLGQLALSCAQCHDQHAGGRLGGSPIPQGHPTAYPTYRLQWQAPGSLARRLRGCLTGVRAEPFAPMSAEMIELELFLASRAAGMIHEGPGVRP
jgi:sulfur-oxidizing protein SoxA